MGVLIPPSRIAYLHVAHDDISFIATEPLTAAATSSLLGRYSFRLRFSPSVAISRIKERARRASCFDRKEIQPGQKKVLLYIHCLSPSPPFPRLETSEFWWLTALLLVAGLPIMEKCFRL